MFKSLKNIIAGSKSDCCSITIKEVENNREIANNESKECCKENENSKKPCCK